VSDRGILSPGWRQLEDAFHSIPALHKSSRLPRPSQVLNTGGLSNLIDLRRILFLETSGIWSRGPTDSCRSPHRAACPDINLLDQQAPKDLRHSELHWHLTNSLLRPRIGYLKEDSVV
jgi:hypothetical protein